MEQPFAIHPTNKAGGDTDPTPGWRKLVLTKLPPGQTVAGIIHELEGIRWATFSAALEPQFAGNTVLFHVNRSSAYASGKSITELVTAVELRMHKLFNIEPVAAPGAETDGDSVDQAAQRLIETLGNAADQVRVAAEEFATMVAGSAAATANNVFARLDQLGEAADRTDLRKLVRIRRKKGGGLRIDIQPDAAFGGKSASKKANKGK